MTNTYTRLGAWLAMILLPSACLETIDLETEFERKLVVNCILTPGPEQSLSITYNAPAGHFVRNYEPVKDADARLFCEENEVGRFLVNKRGSYDLIYEPIPGKEYLLSVTANDGSTVTAKTTFPERTPLRYMGYTSETIHEFKQDASEAPYWSFCLAMDEMILDNPLVPVNSKEKMMNDIGCSHPRTDAFNAMDEPMFAAIGMTNGTTMAHYYYVRIDPVLDDGSITFYVEQWLAPYQSHIVFRSVSKEYDAYLKTSLRKALAYQSVPYDPTAWLDEDGVYSNIEGGLGIFGAYSDQAFFIFPRW